MAHETGGSATRDRDRHDPETRDRDGRKHDPYDPYERHERHERHERETRDMPERHGTREDRSRSSYDDWDVDIREGYR
ncbi:hypothetical protein ACFS5L_33605 [Streptomyces phyllanthi]|uniref:Uncharacterized protein n=1 Tax=Streptomyces phyllanthi TaxID=1803180 RepID=A0A5N8W2B1_9ACTN|nr:hypothetical protein [Streptomyces phyllanthi]MPY41631.1 hypothetical protein [Streptomyces phyllanthi]